MLISIIIPNNLWSKKIVEPETLKKTWDDKNIFIRELLRVQKARRLQITYNININWQFDIYLFSYLFIRVKYVYLASCYSIGAAFGFFHFVHPNINSN